MSRSWFPFPPVNEDPEIRVFCFAHAGGNASFFRDWRGNGGHVEFYPVQLPGHGNRLGEPPLTRLEDLVVAFAEAAEPLLDRPFALFGHSFGAWLAHAAAQQIRTNYGQTARHLFVSGNIPPKKTSISNPILLNTDAEAKHYLKLMGGTSSDLIENKDLISMFLPVLRNDINLLRNYTDKNDELLNFPITAFLGSEDPLHTQNSIFDWHNYTLSNFDYHLFPGGHFYLENFMTDITLIIASSLIS